MSAEKTPSIMQRVVGEAKHLFVGWLTGVFRRKTTSVERNPLTSTTKALIANLMGMR